MDAIEASCTEVLEFMYLLKKKKEEASLNKNTLPPPEKKKSPASAQRAHPASLAQPGPQWGSD